MTLAELRDWPLTTRLAAAGLVAALLLDVAVVVHALRLRDEPAVAPLAVPVAPRIVIQARLDAELTHSAASKTPFDASPPTAAIVASVLPPPPAPAQPRLVGTVVESQGGGFVILELPDARMQVVRIGERAGGLRLRSVTAGEAVFDDLHGARVSLRTPAPGAEPRP